jgi:hypothetical protein
MASRHCSTDGGPLPEKAPRRPVTPRNGGLDPTRWSLQTLGARMLAQEGVGRPALEASRASLAVDDLFPAFLGTIWVAGLLNCCCTGAA